LSSHRLRNWCCWRLSCFLSWPLTRAPNGWLGTPRRRRSLGADPRPVQHIHHYPRAKHGVAFGQLSGLGWLFMVVNLAVLVFVLVYYPRVPAGQWSMRLALILILAGDLATSSTGCGQPSTSSRTREVSGRRCPGRLLPTFIDFKIWPVWNVSDMCLVGE